MFSNWVPQFELPIFISSTSEEGFHSLHLKKLDKKTLLSLLLCLKLLTSLWVLNFKRSFHVHHDLWFRTRVDALPNRAPSKPLQLLLLGYRSFFRFAQNFKHNLHVHHDLWFRARVDALPNQAPGKPLQLLCLSTDPWMPILLSCVHSRHPHQPRFNILTSKPRIQAWLIVWMLNLMHMCIRKAWWLWLLFSLIMSEKRVIAFLVLPLYCLNLRRRIFLFLFVIVCCCLIFIRVFFSVFQWRQTLCWKATFVHSWILRVQNKLIRRDQTKLLCLVWNRYLFCSDLCSLHASCFYVFYRQNQILVHRAAKT